jgi:Rieske Fe-S protein
VGEERLAQVALDRLGSGNAGLLTQRAERGADDEETKDETDGRQQGTRGFTTLDGATEHMGEGPGLPDQEQSTQKWRCHGHGQRQTPLAKQGAERS